MGEFQKFVPGAVDKDAQEKKRLSKTEMLILKPHTEGLEKLTREEIEEYINLDIKAFQKTKMNIKTIIIADETQKFLIKNKQKLLNKIKEREENKDER